MIRFQKTISDAATVTAANGNIPSGKARHQIDATGSGTLTIAVDFGSGSRTVYSLDAAAANRLPYCLEAEVVSITFTPSASMAVAYAAEPA